MRRVVVVTGTPASGKTTLSKIIAGQIGALHIDLGKLAMEKRFIARKDPFLDTDIVNIVPLRKHLQEVLRSKGPELIIEGHYSTAIIPREQVWKALVLRCDPAELKRRMRRKKWGRLKIKENILAEILDVCLVEALRAYGGRKVSELETSFISPFEAAHRAALILQGRSRQPAGDIDWIRRLTKEGRLIEFLL